MVAYAFDARPLEPLQKQVWEGVFEYVRTFYSQPILSNVPCATRLVNSDVAGPTIRYDVRTVDCRHIDNIEPRH